MRNGSNERSGGGKRGKKREEEKEQQRGLGDLQMSREVNPALSTVNSPLTA